MLVKIIPRVGSSLCLIFNQHDCALYFIIERVIVEQVIVEQIIVEQIIVVRVMMKITLALFLIRTSIVNYTPRVIGNIHHSSN